MPSTGRGRQSAQRLSATLMDARPLSRTTSSTVKCSTPFGDIDGCTLLLELTCGEVNCAQRLSATLMDAQDDIPESAHRKILCSTPFGDIDGCTFHVPNSALSMKCAQRLSATLMDALTAIAIVTHNSRCAQRLSATLMDAQLIETPSTFQPPCSTPFGDIDGCTRR